MAKPSATQKIPTVLIYMLFSINKNPNPSPIGEKFGLDCCGEPSEIRIVEFAFCGFYQFLKIGSVMRYLAG